MTETETVTVTKTVTETETEIEAETETKTETSTTMVTETETKTKPRPRLIKTAIVTETETETVTETVAETETSPRPWLRCSETRSPHKRHTDQRVQTAHHLLNVPLQRAQNPSVTSGALRSDLPQRFRSFVLCSFQIAAGTDPGFIVRSPFWAKHHVVVQYMAGRWKCPLPPPPQTPSPS